MGDCETGFHADATGMDKLRKRAAKFTACGQLVIGAASERFGRVCSTEKPNHIGIGTRFLQRGEVDERAYGRVARAENRHDFAGVSRPRAAENIGHAVDDTIGVLSLSHRGQAVCADRIWRRPRA